MQRPLIMPLNADWNVAQQVVQFLPTTSLGHGRSSGLRPNDLSKNTLNVSLPYYFPVHDVPLYTSDSDCQGIKQMKNPAQIAHGPMFIGFMFNIFLFGVMTTQVYLYYTSFPRDRLWMKLFVLLIFILDTINSVFNAVYLYDTLILRFGDMEVISTANWLFATEPALVGVVAALVQLFFSWRVTVLTKNYILSAIVALGAVVGGVCGVVTAWEVMQTRHFTEFRNFKVVVIIWLVTASLVDVLITSALVWFLSHKTGFRRSDLMIDRIIRLTVQTGLITSVLATVDLIVYLVDASGNHLIFNYPLGKVYSNSLMSSLNSRKGWGYSSEANDCDDVISDSEDKTTDLPRTSTKAGNERGKTSTSIASRLRAQSISISHGAMVITSGLFSRRPKKRTAPEVHVHVDSLESRDISPRLHWSTHADLEDTSKAERDLLKDKKETIDPARN